MLRTENLCVYTPDDCLFENLDLSFKPGSITILEGPNGFGKSMLLDHLSGIRVPTVGQVFFESQDIAKLKPHLRTQLISSLGQEDTTPTDTLVSNRIRHGFLQASHNPIHELSQSLGIEDLLNRRLGTLSGGQRKRVHIARCLIHSTAKVYILDEPDAGLDTDGKAKLWRLLEQKADAGGIVILAMHQYN
ncbi:MAG: ATP-binding cassette domain-containing protein [Deltaproteobacteria bacterium]|nr:ATP-binding cassette domain-containing protein [Deltaproteobacteria bacterium]